MKVLGLIPARGGSKGVPRKNIRLLAGKPLLAYTAEAALAATRLTRVVLSTDDEEIAEIGRGCGIEVPFLRPAELAEDTTPTLPVVQHAVHFLESRGERFDAICLLQPTNPLRQASDIDGCTELLERAGADTVFTMLSVPPEHNPHWVYFQNADGSLRLSTGEASPIPRRQELPPAFHREGSVYVARRDVVMNKNSLYGSKVIGFEIERGHSVNIDNLEDWERAESLLLKTISSTK
ncbi:MAG: acylneuraminate cytidylyltransferase family protein [Acidobacteria bacterium]|nr:acylneuraminate cytidylyltransferase family protein [Acidobacteriota bacterium]